MLSLTFINHLTFLNMSGTYIIIALVLIIIVSGLFIVKQQTAAIIERFGKFQSDRKAGLQLKIPLIDRSVNTCGLFRF